MKKHIIIICCLIFVQGLFSGCNQSWTEKKDPVAVHGTLDLTGWNLEKDGSVDLEGEWEFYWKEHISPKDFAGTILPKKPEFISVPGCWNNYKFSNSKLTGKGYATYRLTVTMDNPKSGLALRLQVIQTAFSIFVNGKRVSAVGVPGSDEHSTKPYYRPHIIQCYPETGNMEIVLHISNFHHKLGGPWGVIRLGTSKKITYEWIKALNMELFVFGAVFIMGLYHIGLFLFRKSDRSLLFFGFFCLLISFRILATGEIYLIHLWPDISWNIVIKIEYFTYFLAIPTFCSFIYNLFPREFSKKFLNGVVFLGFLFFFLTAIFPIKNTSHTIPTYQIITIISGIYSIYTLILATFRKRELAIILLAGVFILFLSAINDILYAADIIQTMYMSQIGLMVFIFFQAFFISIRFSKAFMTVENQSLELLDMNEALKNEIRRGKKLEKDLDSSHADVQNARSAIILGLAKLAEYRDEDTGAHLERIREFSKILAESLSKKEKYSGYITMEYITDIYSSSILHDIGKVGVSDSILLKPGKLTAQEFERIKQHPVIGGNAIDSVESKFQGRSFLTLGKQIAYYHHEKWDGTGYPEGLAGEEIPLSARIVALADVYDALTSKRTYKEAFSHEKSYKIILSDRGSHFDPDIVDAFLECEDVFKKIREKM